MTVGEYIQNTLDEKGISVSELKERIGLKSRSSIYRLLRSNGITENQLELVKKIEQAVNFSDDEHNTLYELINTSSSPFYESSRKILTSIYTKKNGTDIYCYKDLTHISLSDILMQLSGNIHVLLIGSVPPAANNAIEHLVAAKKNIHVDHFFDASRLRLSVANELLTMLTLNKYEAYTPYLCSETVFNNIDVVIFSETTSLETYLTAITFCGNRSFQYANTAISDSMYSYIKSIFEKKTSQVSTIKKEITTVFDYIQLIDNIEEMYSSTTFHFEGIPCFSLLNSEMFHDLLAEINYFGYPREHRYIQHLHNSFINFDKMLTSDKREKKYILLDKASTAKSISTGYIHGLPSDFHPLSHRQIKSFLQRLIKLSESKDSPIEFRFIDNATISTPFTYYKNKALLTDNQIKNKYKLENNNVFNLMNDFTSHVWKTYTISNDDSKKILMNMIN